MNGYASPIISFSQEAGVFFQLASSVRTSKPVKTLSVINCGLRPSPNIFHARAMTMETARCSRGDIFVGFRHPVRRTKRTRPYPRRTFSVSEIIANCWTASDRNCAKRCGNDSICCVGAAVTVPAPARARRSHRQTPRPELSFCSKPSFPHRAVPERCDVGACCRDADIVTTSACSYRHAGCHYHICHCRDLICHCRDRICHCRDVVDVTAADRRLMDHTRPIIIFHKPRFSVPFWFECQYVSGGRRWLVCAKWHPSFIGSARAYVRPYVSKYTRMYYAYVRTS